MTRRTPEPGSPAFIFLEVIQATREHDVPNGILLDIFQHLTEEMQYRAATSLIEIIVKESLHEKLSQKETLLYITQTGIQICDELDTIKARTSRILEAIRQDFPTKGPQI